MILNLKSYSDLGKCSLGSLLEVWNTETNHIKVNSKEIVITKIEDLFPYLWRSSGASIGTSEGRDYFFYDEKESYWWERYERERIERIVKYAKNYAQRYKKETEIARDRFSWMSDDDFRILKEVYEIIRQHPYKKKYVIPSNIKTSMCLSYERRLEEVKKKLIEDNTPCKTDLNQG